MGDLEKKLESLRLQQEQAKELFIKCQGAIEVIEEMIKEASKEKKDNKK
tara:strand:- start:354 stop:500 length:147 start_codon:yes stop_codon:yes gene_type:complete